MTLEQALDLARERSPTIVAARAAIAEARGRAVGAAVLLRDNPLVDGAAGARLQPEGSETLEARLGLSQVFELGGQRAARMSAADAGVGRAEADSEAAVRRGLRDVAVAFFVALHAAEFKQVANDADAVAADTVSISERRFAAGDVARLDVGLAEAARSRSKAAVLDAEARSIAALGELRALLGLPAGEAIEVRGSLAPRQTLPAEDSVIVDRPDLRAREAEIREAKAQADLGRATRWPDLGIGAEYERDQNDNLALGRLSLTLPVFDNGQGLRAESMARESRLRAELEAARLVTAGQLSAAAQVHRSRAAAAEELLHHAVPRQNENGALARQAYESGQLGLVDYLAVRREVIGTRQDALDRAFESAVSAIELEFTAGALK